MDHPISVHPHRRKRLWLCTCDFALVDTRYIYRLQLWNTHAMLSSLHILTALLLWVFVRKDIQQWIFSRKRQSMATSVVYVNNLVYNNMHKLPATKSLKWFTTSLHCISTSSYMPQFLVPYNTYRLEFWVLPRTATMLHVTLTTRSCSTWRYLHNGIPMFLSPAPPRYTNHKCSRNVFASCPIPADVTGFWLDAVYRKQPDSLCIRHLLSTRP